MEQEDKNILREILNLEHKNSKILDSMRKSMLWGRAFRVFYWLFLVAVSIGAFYYIEPYVQSITDAYGGFKEDIQNVKNAFQKK